MDQRCTCCVFGHRTITESKELHLSLYEEIEKIILNEKIDTVLFGSKSRFNDLCLEIVSQIKKEKYPHVKRIYVRAEYPYIRERYKEHLLERYEDSYFPQQILRSGRSVYIERNFEMIDRSRFCIVYYDKQSVPDNRKSGTEIALEYAVKKGKEIIKFPLL